MPTAQDRYRPQSAGQPDDSQRLASLAALLAADPKLSPTAAIRSLGVDRPADIRRLRTKLRIEQAKLLTSTRRPGLNGTHTPRMAPAPAPAARSPLSPEAPLVAASASKTCGTPPAPFFIDWCDMSFGALSAAFEAQSVITQCWLRLPAVSMALRAQLALGAVGVAIYSRNKKRPLFLH
jgi:hypothetical protein